jgi:DNA-binding Lrp family transcriptional regulator
MDAIDRRIVDTLQEAFPVCERPFLAAASGLGLSEDELIARIDRLFNADRLGGAFMLAAMQVPQTEFDAIAATVNAMPAVAHNYARDHALNMWFVLATETPEGIDEAIRAIEGATGLPVHAFPKEREYFVELKLPAAEQTA